MLVLAFIVLLISLLIYLAGCIFIGLLINCLSFAHLLMRLFFGYLFVSCLSTLVIRDADVNLERLCTVRSPSSLITMKLQH